MADTNLQVELVAADRLVWSGEATMVIARTTEGDIGVLPGHAPNLSLLVDGVVDITHHRGRDLGGGRERGLPVRRPRPGVGARRVRRASHDIDLEQARHDLERARAAGEDDEDALARCRNAEARIRAAERTS